MKQTRSFKMKFKSIDDSGQFEGYAAAYSLDQGGDIIRKGAFSRTLENNKSHPILWQHDPTKPIGAGVDAYEDSKGLFVKGQLCLEVQQAREARALMAQGALKGLSIGYESIQDELDEKSGNRFITEIKLYEYSPVTFPMNEDATIESVKDHKQVFDEALTALLISIRSVKRTSTKLPPYCVEAAQEALNELDTILRNNGSQGNSSSGNLLDHDLKLRPGVGEVDSEMLHSIERLRRNIKHSMKK